MLIAEDHYNDKKIAELCFVSVACITKWKRRPEFKERVAELTQIFADKALKEGLARREKRVTVLVQMHDKLLQIVEERAADPALQAIPGGKTGLVTRQMKGIGKGKEFRLVEQYQADTRLVKELRGVEEQIARELGQWQERIEVEDVSLADVMAKARQRKPEARSEPIAVEQDMTVPGANLPN